MSQRVGGHRCSLILDHIGHHKLREVVLDNQAILENRCLMEANCLLDGSVIDMKKFSWATTRQRLELHLWRGRLKLHTTFTELHPLYELSRPFQATRNVHSVMTKSASVPDGWPFCDTHPRPCFSGPWALQFEIGLHFPYFQVF